MCSTAIGTQLHSQKPNEQLLKPSLQGRPVLLYQQLQVGPNITTLGWLYSPDPTSSCNEPKYRVDVFSHSEIKNANSQRDLGKLEDIEANAKNKTICSHLLMDQANNTNYLRISAVQVDNSNDCAESAHFYGLHDNDEDENIWPVSGTSASFEIPDNLRNDASVQLIWSKDDNTQCICPPVEQLISQCACNIANPTNMVTISNNYIAITNLARQMEDVALYFVSTVSSACNGICRLRSVVKVFRIIQGMKHV